MGSSKSKHQNEDEQYLFSSCGNLYDYYEIEELIGVGQAGLILKAVDKKSGKLRTIKEFSHHKMLTGIKDDLDRQISILKKTDHPNVINIFEVCKTPFADYLVYEHLEGQCLMELILNRLEENSGYSSEKLFSAEIIKSFMKDILYAISYCHNQKVVHNDICADNFVFVKQINYDQIEIKKNIPTIKLIDFGISFEEKNLDILKQREFNRKYGQIHFRAPETFQDDFKKDWNFEGISKRDVWGAGVIYYLLLTGKPLVLGRKKAEVRKNLKSLIIEDQKYQELNDDIFNDIDDESKDLLKRMLKLNPYKRISAQEALQNFLDQNLQETTKKELISTLNAIKNFDIEDNIDRKFRSLIISHLIKDESKKGIEFSLLDTDGDGSISNEDLQKMIPKLYPEISNEDSAELIENIMKKCDWNNDKNISYREFLTTSLIIPQDDAQTLREITNFFFCFRSDSLTESQIKLLIKGVTDEEWEIFFKKVDTDENGTIETTEFEDYLKRSVFRYIN